MKFFEAIYRGSMETGQATGRFITTDDGWVETCAVGAALYVTIGENALWNIQDAVSASTAALVRLKAQFPETDFEKVVDSPKSCSRDFQEMSLLGAIYELNDSEGWSREKIAGWVQAGCPKEGW